MKWLRDLLSEEPVLGVVVAFFGFLALLSAIVEIVKGCR